VSYPLSELLPKVIQLDKPVFGITDNRHVATDLALGIDEGDRVIDLTAGVALVSSGTGGFAAWADALHVAVREIAFVVLAIELPGLTRLDVPLFIEVQKEASRGLVMRRTGSTGKIVKLDIDSVKSCFDAVVIALDHHIWSHAFRVR